MAMILNILNLPRYLIENKTPANTDGRVNKLVMVFANPAPMTDPAKTCTRTPAPERNINPAS